MQNKGEEGIWTSEGRETWGLRNIHAYICLATCRKEGGREVGGRTYTFSCKDLVCCLRWNGNEKKKGQDSLFKDLGASSEQLWWSWLEELTMVLFSVTLCVCECMCTYVCPSSLQVFHRVLCCVAFGSLICRRMPSYCHSYRMCKCVCAQGKNVIDCFMALSRGVCCIVSCLMLYIECQVSARVCEDN